MSNAQLLFGFEARLFSFFFTVVRGDLKKNNVDVYLGSSIGCSKNTSSRGTSPLVALTQLCCFPVSYRGLCSFIYFHVR